MIADTEIPDGYPRLARFMSSSGDLHIFREFRYLQVRLLLHLQDELREIEAALYRMDEHDDTMDPGILKNRERLDKDDSERTKLMRELHEKLKEYCELLMLTYNLMHVDRPSSLEYSSLKAFFDKEAPQVQHEVFVDNQTDMRNFKAGLDEAWLDQKILGLLVRFDCRPLQWLFSTKGIQERAGKTAVAFSVWKVYIFKMTLLVVTMLALFIVPLWPLYWWTSRGINEAALAKIMGLQLSCAFMLGVVLSVCTRARKHEIFTACAGYMAILVVFMGQGSGNSGTS